MAKIVTTSELQKSIGKLVGYVSHSWLVITNKGKPKVIMLPYFDDNEDSVAEYLEDYEMNKSREVLQSRWKKSLDSGLSDLVI